MVALIYNWWTLFVRLAQPHKHCQAIASRPLLLHGVATHHPTPDTRASRSPACTPSARPSNEVLTNLAGFLRTLKAPAEQWTDADRLRAILTRAFATCMRSTAGPSTLSISKTAPT
ncbi:MAG: hypothetical protein P0120_24525 [Nitrospira sp.]|nr:hypothetical protein [Nitrospira sp.]